MSVKGISEFTATVVSLAILLSATASMLAYYNNLMDRMWYETGSTAQSESYKCGVKVAVVDRRGNEIWLYNYGWNEAFIEAVEVDGSNSTSWYVLNAVSKEELNRLPPKELAMLVLNKTGEDIKIYFRGGLCISV